jgi:hypothetical protein
MAGSAGAVGADDMAASAPPTPGPEVLASDLVDPTSVEARLIARLVRRIRTAAAAQ